MTTVKKPATKKDNYATLKAIVDTMEAQGFELGTEDVTYDSLREFIAHEVELLDNKAAAAAKRAADKKIEGDALRDRVYGVLSADEFMTVPAIVEALGDEDVSNQMATARLTQLFKLGMVTKDMVDVTNKETGKTKKLSGYKRIG